MIIHANPYDYSHHLLPDKLRPSPNLATSSSASADKGRQIRKSLIYSTFSYELERMTFKFANSHQPRPLARILPNPLISHILLTTTQKTKGTLTLPDCSITPPPNPNAYLGKTDPTFSRSAAPHSPLEPLLTLPLIPLCPRSIPCSPA